MISAPLPTAGAAVPGDLDPTFGLGGKVVTPTTGVGTAVVKQPDGKLVVVGGTDDATIAPAGMSQVIRYNVDGSLDSTFGSGGIVTSNTGSANAVALQANLKIVIAGTSDTDVAVSRLNANGTLDTTFGNAGQVLLNLTSGSFTFASASGIAVDSNGKIVVVGTIVNSSELEDFLVMRFNTNGTLDTTFNPAGLLLPGVVTTSVQSQEQDFAAGVAIQADGRIVVVGSTKSGEFAMVRYLPTGALDTTFGAGGTGTVFASPKVAEGAAVTLQSDGKIVVAGSASVTNPTSTNCIDSLGHYCEYSDMYIARYLANGQLDPTFGIAGARTVPVNPRGNDDFAEAVALQADGKVVVAGLTERSIHTYSNGGIDESFSASTDFAVARLMADGSLDTTFGVGGKVVTDFASDLDEARGTVVQADGKIVAVGSGLDATYALARYDVPVIAPPPPPPVASNWFIPVTPARLVDTRSGAKVGNAAGNAEPLTVNVLNKGGLPGTGIGALALNVTVVAGEKPTNGDGYVTVYPCGTRPDASNLNFSAGQTIPNSVIAPVSASGNVCFYVYGAAHLLVDVSGYFPAGVGFNPLTPTRIVDTRSGAKIGNAAGNAEPLTVNVFNKAGLPATGIAALALNVTVVAGEKPTNGDGYVTVYPCGTRPDASNLNFSAGQTIPNSVIAPISASGNVCFYVYGTAHLLVDVSGFIRTGTGFVALAPTRLSDTRSGAKVGNAAGNAEPLTVNVFNKAGLPGSKIAAVALNVTVVAGEKPTNGDGYVTVYPCGTRPDASNLNFSAGQTIPNSVIAPVSASGNVCFYVYGTAHLLVDVSAYFPIAV